MPELVGVFSWDVAPGLPFTFDGLYGTLFVFVFVLVLATVTGAFPPTTGLVVGDVKVFEDDDGVKPVFAAVVVVVGFTTGLVV